MTLAEELQWRGFINQTTFTDITSINEPEIAYFGRSKSDSITIGNLGSRNDVRNHSYKSWVYKIILLGGATGMIEIQTVGNRSEICEILETVNNNVES